jgi:hypothetical protein
MSYPQLIASQTIASGGSVTSSAVAFTPLVVSGASQSGAGAAVGSGGPVYADSTIMGAIVNPPNSSALSAPGSAVLQLSVDDVNWVTVATQTFNTVPSPAPLATNNFMFDLNAVTVAPSAFGLVGSTPAGWQWARVVINGATGGNIVAQASQGLLSPQR